MFRFPENVDTTLPTLNMASVTFAEIRDIVYPERDNPTSCHAAKDTRDSQWNVSAPESQGICQLHTQIVMQDGVDYLSDKHTNCEARSSGLSQR
jgi:hypothetical protein